MRFRFWLAAVVTLALDQLSKAYVVRSFTPGESRIAIPHLLYWTYVQNTHGAFGLFGNSAVLLIAMAMVVLGVFWFAFRDAAQKSVLVRVAFGGIVGGAIGNIVDRLHYHMDGSTQSFVVDFIDLRWWPVFNIADSCITIGVVLLVLHSMRKEKPAADAALAQSPEPAVPAEPAR